MIKIELLRPTYNGQNVLWQRLAVLSADEDRFSWIEGDPTLIDRSIPVADLRNGRPLTFDENPEEWVRCLPTLFRNGDLIVNVLEDTNPLPSELLKTPDSGEPLELHDPARSHVGAHA